MKIASIVITYNRLELLKKVISGIKNQTKMPDRIIVVNNSSTDGTSEWLESQDGLYVVNQDNVGSSGGQFTGMKTAFDQGYEWIWVMDDDVVADPGCLEELSKNIDEKTVHTPLRLNLDGEVYLNDTIEFNLTNPFSSIWARIIDRGDLNNDYIKADGITFEGPLFHRSLIEEIGLPQRKFFIFADDSEFFIRAKKSGYKINIVKKATLKRQLPQPAKSDQFDWKAYYSLRNIIAIDRMHGNLPVRLIRPLGYLFSWIAKAKGWNNTKTVLRAFKDGYTFKP